MTPYDINGGNCDEFAWKIHKKLKGVLVYEVDFFKSDLPRHFWVKYRGRFYDAECLRGVKDYIKLPIFKSVKGYKKPRRFKDEVFIWK